MPAKRAILVHGGAWAIPSLELQPHRAGVEKAARAGWEILARGGRALDAVQEAVRSMEENPAFNAGIGSVLNARGEVEMDAAIMDGETLAAGAVASVKGIRSPIDLARRVLERSPHVFLVGSGALEFARSEGVATCEPDFHVIERERDRWQETMATLTAEKIVGTDTVGAVACDAQGHVAAAGSTGGTLRKHPGRVGDTPLIGSGLYADDELGAAASTGWGEGIMRVVMARSALERLRSGSSEPAAAGEILEVLARRTGGRAGILIVSPTGERGWAFTTPHMAHAYMTDELDEPVVGI